MGVLSETRLGRFLGVGSGGARSTWVLRAIVAFFVIISVAYLAYLYINYSVFYARDIQYPKMVIADLREAAAGDPGGGGILTAATQGTAVGTGEPAGASCAPSYTVAMQTRLVEIMVSENAWVPARPLYKIGFFGFVGFDRTPWFDNKAAEQIGMLDVARRLAIELTDSLGRVRGTSVQDDNLTAAQSALRIDENAWFVNNPFNASINTISPSAATSYEKAITLYKAYNERLRTCDAIFDTRADNLRETLSRFTAALGSMSTELSQRSHAKVYDPHLDLFVDGEGNNAGWFDFQADNYFYRARGMMYGLHGIMQGMRIDFDQVVRDNNVGPVWDKMEQAIAEAAEISPLIVSNGAPDALLMPDHLGKMGEILLRARTSMVELRDILSD